MRTFTTIVFLIIVTCAAAQPGWSKEEFEAYEIRLKLEKNPGDQQLIFELALVSENLDEIKAARHMDREHQGAVSCHLAEVEMRAQHWKKMENALADAHRDGCRSERYYQLLVELNRHIPTSPQQLLEDMNEGLMHRPNDYVLLVEKSKALLQLHQPIEAQMLFERAITIEPLYYTNEFQNWIRLCHEADPELSKLWLEKSLTLTTTPNYGLLAHFHRVWYGDIDRAAQVMQMQLHADSMMYGQTISMYTLHHQVEYGFILYEQGERNKAFDVWLKAFEYFTGQYQLLPFYMFESKLVLDGLPGIELDNYNINYSGEAFKQEIDRLRFQHPEDLFLPFFRNLPDYRWLNMQQRKDADGFVMAYEALRHIPDGLKHANLINYYAASMYYYFGDTNYANTYFSIAEEDDYRPTFYYQLAQYLNR